MQPYRNLKTTRKCPLPAVSAAHEKGKAMKTSAQELSIKREFQPPPDLTSLKDQVSDILAHVIERVSETKTLQACAYSRMHHRHSRTSG